MAITGAYIFKETYFFQKNCQEMAKPASLAFMLPSLPT